jgi:hypothetical protein
MRAVTLKEINVFCIHTAQGTNVNICFVAVKMALTIFTDIFVMNNVAMLQKCQL